MSERLNHIGSAGLVGLVSVSGGPYLGRSESNAISQLRAAIGWLPVALIVGMGAWLLLFGYASKPADGEPAAHLATAAAPQLPPVSVSPAKQPVLDPATVEAITAEQPAPVDGLKISSQSWRKGGLGSNAQVTLTLRNVNDYAVRDIEISCAFARPDGSHLTDRTRMIGGTINKNSRKTFSRMHVGFVNVNASKAKCSLLAAAHI